MNAKKKNWNSIEVMLSCVIAVISRTILSFFALGISDDSGLSTSASQNFVKMGITVVDNKADVIRALSNLVETTANDSISKRGSFNIGVSGGSLVSFLVTGLPKIKTDFNKWKIFFCDERLVPVEDPDSTYGAYKSQLIDTKAVNLREDQFVVVKQGVTADEAARNYKEKIKKYVPGSFPRFDLLLLGMGPDGHTCSLFPGHELLKEKSKWVAPIVNSPKPPSSRITLTLPVINSARVCAFAVSGTDKAEMIRRIHLDKEELPATQVKPLSGNLHWIVDKDAAMLL